MGNDWKRLTLSEAGIKLIDCVHNTPEDAGAGVPYIGIPQLKDGRIDFDADPRLISEADFLEWTKKANPQAHDVVLSRRCNPGETAIVKAGDRFALGQNLVLLRSATDRVYPPFLRWLTRGHEWWEQVGKFLNVGAVFDSLKCGDIPNFELTIPPIAEQEVIAHILGTLDDKIELNRRMNETLESMARALFKSWFVDFDPVIDNALAAGNAIPEALAARAATLGPKRKPLPENIQKLFPANFTFDEEMGWIPEGWNVKKWGDLATLGYGKNLKDYRVSAGLVRVFGTNGPIGWTDKALCDSAGIIIGRKGAYRGVHYSPDSFFVIDTAFFLKPINPFDLRWAYYEILQLDINSMDSGSAIPSTSREDFYSIPVCAPPNLLIAEFGRLVEAWYRKQCNNEAECNTLAALRDTLLPKLLSGELRIPAAEKLVAGSV